MDFDIDFHDARLVAILNIRDRLVVGKWAQPKRKLAAVCRQSRR
jgi:hypothetical protein